MSTRLGLAVGLWVASELTNPVLRIKWPCHAKAEGGCGGDDQAVAVSRKPSGIKTLSLCKSMSRFVSHSISDQIDKTGMVEGAARPQQPLNCWRHQTTSMKMSWRNWQAPLTLSGALHRVTTTRSLRASRNWMVRNFGESKNSHLHLACICLTTSMALSLDLCQPGCCTTLRCACVRIFAKDENNGSCTSAPMWGDACASASLFLQGFVTYFQYGAQDESPRHFWSGFTMALCSITRILWAMLLSGRL